MAGWTRSPPRFLQSWMTLIGDRLHVAAGGRPVRHPTPDDRHTVTETQLRRSLRLSSVSPIVYGATIGLAFISPFLPSIGVWEAISACGPSARKLIALQQADGTRLLRTALLHLAALRVPNRAA